MKRENSCRREITSTGDDSLWEVLKPAHRCIERDHGLAYSRHTSAFFEYRAILLFQDNGG